MGAPQVESLEIEPPIRGLLRTVNEHVTRFGGRLGDVLQEYDYVCECTDVGCSAPVRLTPGRYSELVKNPGWFVVAPGHVGPEERIVDEGQTYVVVTRRHS
jgi:hypothetical protein